MIFRVNAEDLLSVLIEETQNSKESIINIEYRKINTLRDELRKKGIMSDLGSREIETISTVFPNNILIETTSIKVVKSAPFVSRCVYHAAHFDESDISLLLNIWKRIK